jgi:BAG domain
MPNLFQRLQESIEVTLGGESGEVPTEEDLLAAIDEGDADRASLIARRLARLSAERRRQQPATGSDTSMDDAGAEAAREPTAAEIAARQKLESDLDESLAHARSLQETVEESLQTTLLLTIRRDLIGGGSDAFGENDDVAPELMERARGHPQNWRRRVEQNSQRLERATLKLDSVGVGKHADLRERRKGAIQDIQRLQGRIDLLNELVLHHERFLDVVIDRSGTAFRALEEDADAQS